MPEESTARDLVAIWWRSRASSETLRAVVTLTT
jgi:hypothetical protein